MTDSELKQAFSTGFSNPQHLTDLLKRTDLPPDRLQNARTNLAQAHISGQFTKEALQRFISQLNKAKSWHQFDQVLAELRHANRLIESGVVAQDSLVFTGAKLGREYNFGSTTVKIDPVYEGDVLYLGTDGLIHLHEVKHTARALRNKFKKNLKQLERMQRWCEEEPDKREIRIVISREAGWTEVFAHSRHERQPVLQTLTKAKIPLTISTHDFNIVQMQKLWDETMSKAKELSMYPPRKEFFELIPTLDIARKVGILWE